MNTLKMYVLLAASFSLLFLGCSNKSSDEACQHAVTMNLDTGNFDAVIASGCADSMQKGAAYFGKAGFAVADVINTFSDIGSSNNGSSGSTESDINIYMTSLVKKVDENTLTYMDKAKVEYSMVTESTITASDRHKDAQFYISLVDAVKSLSLLKIILDVDGDGQMNTTCDMNDNQKPDEVDAMSCGLYTAASITCPSNTQVDQDSAGLTFAEKPGFTFRGLIISVSGAGANITTCPNPNEYKQLLYWQTAVNPASWTAVATNSGTPSCLGSDGNVWPCPIIQNDQPLDLVTTIDISLMSAIDSMNIALQPISGATITTQSDVQTGLQDIKNQACPSEPCTSANIADYLQTYQ